MTLAYALVLTSEECMLNLHLGNVCSTCIWEIRYLGRTSEKNPTRNTMHCKSGDAQCGDRLQAHVLLTIGRLVLQSNQEFREAYTEKTSEKGGPDFIGHRNTTYMCLL